MDIANSIADSVYRLGFENAADMAAAGSWVNQNDLYQWADEIAKHLAYDAGVFVTWDTSIGVGPNISVYGLPATHVFTLLASLAGVLLRITPVRDLEAMDATWPTTTGPAARC